MRIDWLDRLMIAASAVTVLVLILLFVVSPYQSDFDESFQITGAHSLAQGLGYTVSSISTVALETQQAWITGWPMGFSGYLLCMSMLFGCSAELAIKLFTLFCILFGSYNWIRLYADVNRGYKNIGFFLAFISITLGACFTSKTTLFYWSFFPLITYWLLQMNDRREQRYYYIKLFLISLICALLIAFRFATVGLIAPIGLFILYYRRTEWMRIIMDGLFFIILPALVFLGLLWVNKHYSGMASSMFDAEKSHINFSSGWLRHLSTALFANYHLSVPLLSSVTVDDTKSFVFQFAACIVMAFLLVRKDDKKITQFSLLFLCFWLGNYLFLLALDMMSYTQQSVWVPTGDSRYYWHMACIPILLLIYLLKDFVAFRIGAFIVCLYLCWSVIAREQLRFVKNTLSYSQSVAIRKVLEKKSGQHQLVILPELNPDLNRKVFQMVQFKAVQGYLTGFDHSIQTLKAKRKTTVSIVILPECMEKPLFNGTSCSQLVADGSFEYTDLKFCHIYSKTIAPGHSMLSE